MHTLTLPTAFALDEHLLQTPSQEDRPEDIVFLGVVSGVTTQTLYRPQPHIFIR
jgi:hypothetical protein